MIDQRPESGLPHSFKIVDLQTHNTTTDAIKNMTIRGAGAIGAAAGYAMAQAFRESEDPQYHATARQTIEASRPTAQNLFYATERVYAAASNSNDRKQTAIKEAEAIADEDVAAMRKIGEYGADIFRDILEEKDKKGKVIVKAEGCGMKTVVPVPKPVKKDKLTIKASDVGKLKI